MEIIFLFVLLLDYLTLVVPFFKICGASTLYLNIRGLQKGPGKFFMLVFESPGKSWILVVSKRVGTLSFILVENYFVAHSEIC